MKLNSENTRSGKDSPDWYFRIIPERKPHIFLQKTVH